MTVGWLLPLGIAAILLGGLVAVVPSRRPSRNDLSFKALIVTGSALVGIPALLVLAGRAPISIAFQPGLPGGLWVATVDRLSAWFLIIVAGVGTATAWYGLGYLARERAHRPVGLAHGGVALLLAAMICVVTAGAVLPFLLAWEVMAVGAYFLIVFESDREEVRRAGLLYLVLTHAGTLALMAMFLTWSAGQPNLTFAALAAASPTLSMGGAVVLLLGLLGFGVKAGIVPMHFWLPGAHAAAPSHVSALLSGVMIKTGIYGLFRIVTLIGAPPIWWGWVLLGLGLGSAVLGILWAIGQHDLKRVLAYSSVENIGIILICMGVGVLGRGYGEPEVAVLGFAAALLHTLNHALFKSLLFLGAGAVVRAAGTRALDRLGGLGKRLPLTAICFGIGAAAIIGLPPLNGFVGEWVAFQALLAAGREGGVLSAAVFGAAGLALVAGLVLLCFVRVVSTAFLGQPRSPAARTAPGDDMTLLLPMFPLAAACVTLGLFPATVVPSAVTLAAGIAGQSGGRSAALLAPMQQGLWSVTAIGMSLVVLGTATWVYRSYRSRVRPPQRQATWGCAYPEPTPSMQYTAASFGAPLLSAFGSVAEPQAIRTPFSFETDPKDKILVRLVLPLWARVKRTAVALRPLQQGRVTQYLLYIVLTVLLLLAVLFISLARGQ